MEKGRVMPRRAIGAASVSIPELGFGGAAVGNLYRALSDAQADAALAEALRLGLDYLDTAPHYGFGLSERRMGRALARLDPQETVVVSTKVGRTLVAAGRGGVRHGFVAADPFEPVFDYSYDAVMAGFEASAARLGRRRIDMLFAHDLGEATHGEAHDARFAEFMRGGYRAMRELRDAGVVGAIGLGANEWRVCERAMAHADFDAFLLAGRYTLLEQTALDSFLPACVASGVSVIVGGPFNSGVLADATPGRGRYDYAEPPAWVRERVARLKAVCDAWRVPLPAAALQFVLAHPAVAGVIPGLADADQVRQAAGHYAFSIPEGLWGDLRAEGLLHAEAPTPRTRVAA